MTATMPAWSPTAARSPRPEGPYKTKPADPGGKQFDGTRRHQLRGRRGQEPRRPDRRGRRRRAAEHRHPGGPHRSRKGSGCRSARSSRARRPRRPGRGWCSNSARSRAVSHRGGRGPGRYRQGIPPAGGGGHARGGECPVRESSSRRAGPARSSHRGFPHLRRGRACESPALLRASGDDTCDLRPFGDFG